jgi:NADH-quinone oxidoreductase subunit N
MNPLNYAEMLRLAMPEAMLAVTALAVLFVDLAGMRQVERRYRRGVGAAVTCLGCFAALLWLGQSETNGVVGGGMFVVDPLARWMGGAVIGLTALTALISVDADFTDHVGEYFALLLLGTIGMLFLIGTENLLMLFVALELTSLSLYVLTAFNQRNPRSAEAALKYFLFGSMAAAFTLYGLSLVYGLSGSLDLRGIAAALVGRGKDPLLATALVMTVMGFGFKVAAVPFHLWAPDAYQGAPTPSAAFIASGSKVASFFILAKVLMLGFDGAEGSAGWHRFASGWIPVVAVLAASSMVLGNLVAIVQSSVKRLLAYSAIAHAGYALLGVAADTLPGLGGLLYYVITYAVATLGAFAVVTLVEDGAGDARLDDFAGLSRRAPLMSFCMLIFVLSLAGIPPLAGFFGKFYVFTAAAGSGPGNFDLLWLVVLAIAMSAVSLYYYLQVLKQIYVAGPPERALAVKPGAVFQAAVLVLAVATVVLGCWPNLLVGRLASAIAAAGF